MSNKQIMLGAVSLRLGVFFLAGQNFASDFYYPFLESVGVNGDPWRTWLNNGGRPDAFPYGVVLFTLLLAIVKFELLIREFLPFFPRETLFIVLLIAIDLLVSKRLTSKNRPHLHLIYLFSPIVIYVNYFYLQTDAIVGALILLYVIHILNQNERSAGIFLGLAIGCKYGVLVIFPFLITFALANRRFRKVIRNTTFWSLPIMFFSYLPSFWSMSFRKMVFSTNEISQLYSLSLRAGPAEVLVFPLIYTLLIIWIWRAGKSNLKVMCGFIGTSLLCLSLTSTTAVGWHLWGLSMLILLSFWDKAELLASFMFLQIAIILRDLFSSNPAKFGIDFQTKALFNLSFSISIALGIAWTLSNLRKILSQADTLQLNKRPLLVSIAGDSGVGKDTLTSSIGKIVGYESLTVISGDGYHKYERGNRRWMGSTHLRPSQNNLDSWQRDIKKSVSRSPFHRQEYNHTIGRFTQQELVQPGDFVISQGLHALMREVSRESDLRVFMEMDDSTRVKFKIERDSSSRNRKIEDVRSEILKRKRDYKDYIVPQKKIADIIFKQKSTRMDSSQISTLKIEIPDFQFAESLHRLLTTYIPMVKFEADENTHSTFYISECTLIHRVTLNLILSEALFSYNELGISEKNLEDGSLGIMSCVCMLFLEHKRRLLSHY